MATHPVPHPATAAPAQLPLADIHLPDPVSGWPALGWWLLGVAVLMALAAACYVGYLRLWLPWQQRRQTRAYCQSLQTRLQQARTEWLQQRQTDRYLLTLQATLKLWCQRYAPQATTLHGDDWLAFLQRCYPNHDFDDNSRRLLQHGHYALLADIDDQQLETLHQSMLNWLVEATVIPTAPTAPTAPEMPSSNSVTTAHAIQQQEPQS